MIRVGDEANLDESTETINRVTTIGKRYYVYTEDEGLRRTMQELYGGGDIGRPYDLILCLKRVQTVRTEAEQISIVETYHRGITNHRGIWETLDHLRRKYYWLGMVKTITRWIHVTLAVGQSTKGDQ